MIGLGWFAVKAGFVIGTVMGFAGVLGWAERKQSAVMQDRVGANRASILGFRALGLFHPLADAIKMLTKEDFVPPFADKVLHLLAPLIAAVAAMSAFAFIPFGHELHIGGRVVPLVAVPMELSALYVLGVVGLAIYGPFLAGAASNSKYALMGSLRAAAQLISYEVTLGLTLMGLFLVFRSLDLQAIVAAQGGAFLGGWLPRWGIVVQPFGFLLFLAAAIAETKRVPFDLPEGESEIIGYFVEYSGMRFGLFMIAEFIEIVLFSALMATLFFGGWQVPGLARLALPQTAVALIQVGAFFTKVAALCAFQLLIRWTLPRFRYDQLMALGWKRLLPLSLLNLVGTAVVLAWLGR